MLPLRQPRDFESLDLPGLEASGVDGLGGDRDFASSAGAATRSTAQEGQARGGGDPRVGNAAPDFTLKTLEGQTVRLSDLRGKPVVLNFWATWCPPCRQEMPDLEKAYQKYKDQGIVFLGVDMKEDEATVQEFIQKNGYHWTFVLDPAAQAANAYLVSAIPSTFFIDADGVIRDLQLGAMSGGLLEAKLSKIR